MDETLKRVLELVNKARKAMGLPEIEDLPKGYTKDATACPLANALGADTVSDVFITFEEEWKAHVVARAWGEVLFEEGAVLTPAALRVFVKQFDKGKYPKYDLDGSSVT